jgi:AraC family transcriptional regulator
MKRNLNIIKQLVEKIEENVAEEINILELSKSSNMSPWHFQRLFKTMIGDSLGGYVRGRRLSLAAEMLRETELRIIDIAFSVGFKSHEAFARAFKKYFKQSPKLFKEQRPSIIINKKPLLTEILFEHAIEGINPNPIIETRAAQQITGLEIMIPSPFVTDKNLCEICAAPWIELWKRQEELTERTPKTFYGLTQSESGNFTEENLNYIAGVPTPLESPIPKGMVIHTVPKQQVAVFEILASIEEDSLQRTVDYIYGYWLPNSDYERDTGDDYGFFEGVIDLEDPNSLKQKYVVPIKSR